MHKHRNIYNFYLDTELFNDTKNRWSVQIFEKSIQGSHSQGNIIFPDISRTYSGQNYHFSRTKYTRFKANKSRYVRKAYPICLILNMFNY